jgi:NarL family two-component system response regulator LiaR
MDKIRIVIGDDHAVFREGTRTLLERENDMVLLGEAGDGMETLKLVEELRPDVVILDISMPKLSGIEVTRQIKARFPEVIVLILTAYDDDEYVFAILEAGAAGYMLKDAASHELIEAVRAVHSGEPVLHPSIARKVIQRAVVGKDKAGGKTPDIGLSQRETEVLQLAARGMSNKEIADTLQISTRTVQRHLNIIFNKLSVGSRTEAIFQGVKRGWISFKDLD